MGTPVSLRTCLMTKMAIKNVFSPMQLCLSCGKCSLGVDFTSGRSGNLLRWEQFMSVGSKHRALLGQSTACNSRAYSKAVEAIVKTQKRKNASKANCGAVAEASEESLQIVTLDTDSNDNHIQRESIVDEIDIEDDEMAHALAAMTGTISLTSDVPVATTSLCVGIDPDLSGAIAVLKTRDNRTVAEVIDVPCVTATVNKRKRRRHDFRSIAILVGHLQAPEGSVAYVEQAMPYPKDGKQVFAGMVHSRLWIWSVARNTSSCWIYCHSSQARVWKTAMGLCGKEFSKNDSRVLASSMFPMLSPQLQRKKDHGRAEALLIAAFGKGMTLTNIAALDESIPPISISSSDEPVSLTSLKSSY